PLTRPSITAIFPVPPSSANGTLLNSIEGATLPGPDRQSLSRRQQTIMRRFFLQIKLLAAGFSSSDGTVFDARKFSVLSVVPKHHPVLAHYAGIAEAFTSRDRMFFRYHDRLMRNYHYCGSRAWLGPVRRRLTFEWREQ